jgi:pimeloyl-ACP methyl ester carboxylesterase
MTTQFVDTPLLRIGFEASGPERGFPIVLAHGWPDDPRTWDPILPALHEAGFRAYAPWLRGYGPTRFSSGSTFRSGQLVALGQDLVDFTSALRLGRHALVGHDWGSRAAYIASSLNEANVAACVALSTGYGTNSPSQRLSYPQTQNYWYHWLMATARGDRLVREDRRAFTRHIWNEWFVHIACAGATPKAIRAMRTLRRASIPRPSSAYRRSRCTVRSIRSTRRR